LDRRDGARVSRAASVDERYVPHHGDPSYTVTRYDLVVDYVPESNRLTGTATLGVRALEPLRKVRLDLNDLRVQKLLVDGARAKYRQQRASVSVELGRELAEGEEAEIMVAYGGRPHPMRGPDGDAGWEELEEGAIVASQPHGAPSWFPCNDLPSAKAPFRLELSVPQAFTVVGNGVPGERRRTAGRVVQVFDQPEPMATYLATVHVGDFVEEQQATSPVPVGFVAPGSLREQAQDALVDQPAMVAFFDRVFGPYPFQRYLAVVTPDDLEIPLEAQGLSIFGPNLLHDGWDAQRLIAHELAHQWFGNSVTLRHWNDIWLHEGFACYAEWLWSEECGRESADERARHHHAKLQAKDQDLLLADPGPDLMFDDRVYKRGALTLHALRRRVGDDAFFTVLRTWTDRFRHANADTADLERVVADVAGEQTDLFDQWVRATAVPDLP
jgi:aminopeptidase N